MQHELLVVEGPEAGRRFTLSEGQKLTIGRGQASDTQLNDPRMSRLHCQVELRGGQAVLTDCGSSSGTLVGDRVVVAEQVLSSGQTFKAGDTRVRYHLEGAQDESTLVGMGSRPKPAADAAPLQELVGQSFAHFRLDEIVTKGHSGMVFKAHDTEKDRPAAVKVLAPEYATTDEQKQRFVRAMKTMLPIRHENIVELYAAGKQGPHCWAAMEYVDGESLDKIIRRIGTAGMLDWREVFRVGVHIGRALEAAFEQKIIHRNLAPQNLLQRSSDKVTKLGDLMLAKALEGTLAKQVTQPGQLIGDVPYMSPERTRSAADADCRSDIYELGAALYALLTGRPPFEGNSLPELIKQVRDAEPEPPKNYHLSVPDQFQDIVLQMLSKRPADRYETPTQLLKELARAGKYQGIEVSQL